MTGRGRRLLGTPGAWLRGALLLGAVAALAACTEPDRIEHARLWEGDPGCEVCREHARDLVLHDTLDLPMVTGARYTLELEFDDSGHRDHCLQPFLSTSWLANTQPAGVCTPEEQRVSVVFRTPAGREGGGERLTVDVQEVRVDDGRHLRTLFSRGWDVRWVPPFPIPMPE